MSYNLSAFNTLKNLDWLRSAISKSDNAFLQCSRSLFPVLFSKCITTRDGFPGTKYPLFLLKTNFQDASPIKTAISTITAGKIIFLRFNLTVISPDLVLRFGKTRSVFGSSFSISLISSRISPVFWYRLSLSFSKHLRIIWLISSGICALNFLGSFGFSVFCFTATLKEVLPSNGTRPVSISYNIIPRE